MKNGIVNELITAMKERIPKGQNLANSLADILYMGKEAVYRRLRGEVAFTIDEVALLSKKLGISIDQIIGNHLSNRVTFDMNLLHSPNTLESYYEIISRYQQIFDYVKGDDTPFVMELPPYRMPTSKAIFRHTWEKGAQYLRKMGGIIMVASIVIWALGYYPNHDEYESVTEQQENSYIGRIGKAMEPVIEPLGFDWKLGIGILSGVGAKELVVSTLGVLYADDAEVDAVSLSERIPITPLVAFGYMVFVLIYFPCIATLAAIKGESGSWKWAVFAGLYTTALAWLMSFAIYQIGGLFL